MRLSFNQDAAHLADGHLKTSLILLYQETVSALSQIRSIAIDHKLHQARLSASSSSAK
jgi:hypothetical protein